MEGDLYGKLGGEKMNAAIRKYEDRSFEVHCPCGEVYHFFLPEDYQLTYSKIFGEYENLKISHKGCTHIIFINCNFPLDIDINSFEGSHKLEAQALLDFLGDMKI
jgi:hypothetical protein